VDVRKLERPQTESPSVLVIAALRYEALGVRGCRVVVTGPGPERAQRGLQRALRELKPERMVAIGLCGGLSPGETIGSCAVPAEVVSEYAEGRYRCAPWPGIAQAGRLVSVNQVAADPHVKEMLHERYQARWVDMETFAWAQVAAEEGVPLTVVRVVVDAATDYLPTWRVRQSWSSVLDVVAHGWTARRTLSTIVRRMLCAP
jgi:nucleoside phosphorylase